MVMSVLNGATFLRESIESILSQSETDFEFIVVDDGSQDATPSILDSYRHDSRLRIYRQPNRGLVESLNRACAGARGRYIARMDADDVARPSRLAAQVKFLDEHPDVGLVGGAVEMVRRDGATLGVVAPPTEDCAIRHALFDTTVFYHPATAFRRDLFAALGGYRHVTDAEDLDLWLRFSEVGRLANLPQVVLRYRIHPQQLSVRKCRQQGLSTAAALAAGAARRAGKPDPLSCHPEITPELLDEMGVSEQLRQTCIAKSYLASLRNMLAIGDYDTAAATIRELPLVDFGRAERWVRADLHLQAARLRWHSGQVAQCAGESYRAVSIRPVVLGRWLKRLFLVSRIRTLGRHRRSPQVG